MVQNKLKDIDEAFVKQFLNSTPTESVLIPTPVLSGLAQSLRQNKTYCFKTDPGPWGWCATCKVTLQHHQSHQSRLSTSNIRSAQRKANLAFAVKKEILKIQMRSLFQLLPRFLSLKILTKIYLMMIPRAGGSAIKLATRIITYLGTNWRKSGWPFCLRSSVRSAPLLMRIISGYRLWSTPGRSCVGHLSILWMSLSLIIHWVTTRGNRNLKNRKF